MTQRFSYWQGFFFRERMGVIYLLIGLCVSLTFYLSINLSSQISRGFCCASTHCSSYKFFLICLHVKNFLLRLIYFVNVSHFSFLNNPCLSYSLLILSFDQPYQFSGGKKLQSSPADRILTTSFNGKS